MGWNNGKLISACEKARKSGDAEELARLTKLVDESQERCTHVGPFKGEVVKEDSKSGRYKAGGKITWCLLCGKVTKYETLEELLAQAYQEEGSAAGGDGPSVRGRKA